MAQIYYTRGLAAEYVRLFRSCETDPERFDEVDVPVSEMEENRMRHKAVRSLFGFYLTGDERGAWILIYTIFLASASK